MIKKKEAPLKVELFSEGEDGSFVVRSAREILTILNAMAQDSSRVALYYGTGNDFILTTLLKADSQGIWLDLGPIASDNQLILHSEQIIFVSSHHRVKIQFVAGSISHTSLGNFAVFNLPLPESLLRIQRREYYRLPTPVQNLIHCIIPVNQLTSPEISRREIIRREIPIMDISGGGIAMVCEPHHPQFKTGHDYEDCSIPLPDIGTIIASLKVKNCFEVTLRNGQRSIRAGCEFTALSGESASLLQRYVIHLQTEARIKV